MIDPRIAQRQIELEKRKKQQQNNLKQGQNKNSASYYSPTPAVSTASKPAAATGVITTKTTRTSSGRTTVPTTPSYSTRQTVNKTFANSSNVSASAKGSVSNALQKANSIADSVYKPNSAIGTNEYTTTTQRQAQQKSLQEQKARENYIYKMNAKKNQKEYGGTMASQTKTFGGDSTPKAMNSVYSAKPAQIKNTGPNVEMTTVKPKKESTFQKVENQTVDLVGGKRKSMFDWLDDWSNLGGGPNKEIAETAKIKGKEKADLTAAAQAKSHFRNPILGYEKMINPPDDTYRHNDVYWNERASKYDPAKSLINAVFSIKPAEIDKIMQNPVEYVPHIAEFADVKFSDKSAANTRNKVFTEYVGGYDEYGLNMDGGIPNAFMHIYLAAKMTDFLGEENTREFLTAHETFTDKQYEKGFLYQQDDIGFDTDVFPQYQKYDNNKEYPLVKHHAEMDLHNNDIGIQIALTTPTDAAEIRQQLEMYLGENETLDDLRIMFDGYSDREILFMKKAVNAVYSGEAAVIWDYPGNNFSE